MISFDVLCLIHRENGAQYLYPNAKRNNTVAKKSYSRVGSDACVFRLVPFCTTMYSQTSTKMSPSVSSDSRR